MSDLCAPTFEQLAERLGFSCAEAGGLVELRSPFGLENWTLPVLELTVILGAILALVYAVIRLRRHGDATNIALWFGAIAYLLIIEPPLYFPAQFGIAEYVDTMFAHNVPSPSRSCEAWGCSAVTAPWSGRSASGSCTTRSTRSSITWARNCVGGSGRWITR
ncbi:MAG: hypothetical protein K0R33_1253 [Mycobacterium sp.]|nr:hypothetical protein [Mycobacterium sp.]